MALSLTLDDRDIDPVSNHISATSLWDDASQFTSSLAEQVLTGNLSFDQIVEASTKTQQPPPTTPNSTTHTHSDGSPTPRSQNSNMKDDINNITNQNIDSYHIAQGEISSIKAELHGLRSDLKILPEIQNLLSTLIADFRTLFVMTGPATSTIAAAQAYREKHGTLPSGPIVGTLTDLQLTVDETLKGEFHAPGYKDTKNTLVKTAAALNTEPSHFSSEPSTAKELEAIFQAHLPGYQTPFHMLAQSLAKVCFVRDMVGTTLKMFHYQMAAGESAHAALIYLARDKEFFREDTVPRKRITDQEEIPKACRKSIHRVPGGTGTFGQGWALIYDAPGGVLGIKI
ncbi:TPA: polymerase complex protein [Tapajos virus]|uniref:Polymerase cofactor VP35 n=1 Tax=Tapajos virus TaxID=2840185 RepID=A0AAD3AVT7_9MONO|nr:polymerase complex protein [Tapajos virus]FAA04058.1 TPA: polymerase complex protein [Tapajos virus]